jgi:hypothetical protein
MPCDMERIPGPSPADLFGSAHAGDLPPYRDSGFDALVPHAAVIAISEMAEALLA